MKLNETRKEDDIYYSGAFWIVGSSIKEIMHGNFEIIGPKTETDYSGKFLAEYSRNSNTHKRLWRDNYRAKLAPTKEYNYFPRGRVSIWDGTAYIFINSLMNTPKIIDAIIDYYSIDKLDIEIELNDVDQGGHYDFELE